MIKIAICEDKLSDLTFLQTCLHQLLTEKQVSYTVTSFTSGKDMYQALTEESFTISFIDIYLDTVNGILLAQRIREKNRHAAIIFTTSSQEYMAEGYQIGVLHYLVKPLTIEGVEEALDRALRTTKISERYIEVTVNRQREQILLRDINFVEFQNRVCILFTNDGEKTVYIRLNELEEMLNDPRFLRCHRSFLVNMDKVVGIEKREFLLADHHRIPINREQAKELQQSYARYKIKKVREGE